MSNHLERIDARLERMEQKLDEALSIKAAFHYLIAAVTGAWAAIGTLFVTK